MSIQFVFKVVDLIAKRADGNEARRSATRESEIRHPGKTDLDLKAVIGQCHQSQA